MRARSWTRVAFAAAVSALTAQLPFTPPPHAALLAQAQTPTTPTFRTDASYVRVDVYATANGRPITDLRQNDLTILEDGERQEIDRFEFINVRDTGSATATREPATVAESRLPVADGRVRLFVLFLDRPHVDDKGSATIRQPLLNALARTIGERDLVAVMTPDMTVLDLAFSSKTTALERFLERDRFWGERSRLSPVDPFETQLKRCYPDAEDAVKELVARRREKRTFDALRSLVEYLGGVREERKAILTFSSGWLRFEPTNKFDNLGGQPPIASPQSPGGISLPRGAVVQSESSFLAECFAERTKLASIDHDLAMREIMAMANRTNTSFYPIDPRGLAVFDDPDAALQAARAEEVRQDARNLNRRLTSLRELAEDTDGLAVVNSNSLDAGLRRIVDDLSSYYLVSYASTGRLDGKFHSIAVRTSRPGVSIRARRGYLSAKAGDSRTSGPNAPPPPAAPDAITVATRAALDRLAGAVRDLPARTSVAVGWIARGQSQVPSFTFVAEIADRARGASVDVVVTTEGGQTAGIAQARIAPGSTSAVVTVVGENAGPAGVYAARVRIQGDAGTETLSVPITLPDAPEGSGALYFRRGQTTGNREVATADLRFRRSDQLRIELPAPPHGPVSARLLDRNGNAMSVPADATLRTADDGMQWITARLAMASLALGDYVVEVSSGSSRLMAPFRIVP